MCSWSKQGEWLPWAHGDWTVAQHQKKSQHVTFLPEPLDTQWCQSKTSSSMCTWLARLLCPADWLLLLPWGHCDSCSKFEAAHQEAVVGSKSPERLKLTTSLTLHLHALLLPQSLLFWHKYCKVYKDWDHVTSSWRRLETSFLYIHYTETWENGTLPRWGIGDLCSPKSSKS